MKRILIFAAIVAAIALDASTASAQLFRRARVGATCRSGVCSNASGYFRTYTGDCFDGSCVYSAQTSVAAPCVGGSCPLVEYAPTSVAPCEAIQPIAQPCEAVQKVEEPAPLPCAPAKVPEPAVVPCDPVETVEPCQPVEAVAPCEAVEECLPCAPVRGTASRPRPVRNAARLVAERLELARINVARIARGLRPLQNDAALEAGARATAVRNSQEGRLRHYGASWEIIAYNYGGGIDGAIRQWLASPAHARILLGSNFTRAGVFMVRDNYGRCWFAARFQ